ncbi:FKBP-type peptidyl-prolyl cis-trans isomerase [Parabacteroides sp. OttesenSCG-928-N08]|nr:FKBP-type peptidyl-prolyl cis-trans isomerase [Parabacteroides sp. OttesenSCG-928-N08]
MKWNKNWLILLFAMLTFTTTSCDDDDEVVIDEEWVKLNEEAIAKVKLDKEFTELVSPGHNGSIYFKVLEQGEGTETVYYTSVVKCYYKGTLVDGTVFDQRVNPYHDPYETSLQTIIQGWAIALQYMKVGDKWEIWIPYHLAYGTVADGNIPAYSALHFEVELVELVEQ